MPVAFDTALAGAKGPGPKGPDQTTIPVEVPVEEPKGGKPGQGPTDDSAIGGAISGKPVVQQDDTVQQGGGAPDQAGKGNDIVQQHGKGKGHGKGAVGGAHNHGWYVSQAAHNGGNVSQVAQSDIGKKHHATAVAGGGGAAPVADAAAATETASVTGGGPNDIMLNLVDQIIALATSLAANNPSLQPLIDQMKALRASLTAGATGGGAAQVPGQEPTVPGKEDPSQDVPQVPVTPTTPELPKEEETPADKPVEEVPTDSSQTPVEEAPTDSTQTPAEEAPTDSTQTVPADETPADEAPADAGPPGADVPADDAAPDAPPADAGDPGAVA